MGYTEYSYLFPPRPENPVPSGMIPFYTNRNWWAQVKKNGTLSLIFTNGVDVIFKTRHRDISNGDHNQWTPTPEIIKFFQNDSNKWNVYCAELLHNKTKHIKNELFIFDKIVDDGIQLVGTTFEDRQLILQSQFIGDQEDHFTRINKNIVVAANFSGKSIHKVYSDIVSKDDNPQDEGIVLKNPKGILKPCFKSNSNDGWQIKVRRPHKNYSFIFAFVINIGFYMESLWQQGLSTNGLI